MITVRFAPSITMDLRTTALYTLVTAASELEGAAATLAGALDTDESIDCEATVGDVRAHLAAVAGCVELVEELWIDLAPRDGHLTAAPAAIELLIDNGLNAAENTLAAGGSQPRMRAAVARIDAYNELRAQLAEVA